MEKIESIDDYVKLRKDVQNQFKKIVSNIFMFPQQVQRYIDLGRIYYEKLTVGILFYIDEETHYKMFYSVKSNSTFSVNKKDKPVYTRIVYNRGKKKEDILQVEKSLMCSNAEKVHETAYACIDPGEGIKETKRVENICLRLMNAAGLRLISLPEGRLEEFLKMKNNMEMIPYYELSYYSTYEWMEEIRKGHVLCVVNEGNELCAIKHMYEESGALTSWVYIRPEYRKSYGIIACLSGRTFQYCLDAGIHKVCGWISETNVDSIEYHQRLGYIWTGRMSDGWLLE